VNGRRACDGFGQHTFRAPPPFLTVLTGGIVLAGWIFGVEELQSLLGPITMKATMAIGLIACGLALGTFVLEPMGSAWVSDLPPARRAARRHDRGSE
jgi:hypothetical protein